MAIRRNLNPAGQAAVRAKINGIKVAELLNDHALGKIEVDPARLESARFLLTRCVSPPPPVDEDGKAATGPVVYAWLGQ